MMGGRLRLRIMCNIVAFISRLWCVSCVVGFALCIRVPWRASAPLPPAASPRRAFARRPQFHRQSVGSGGSVSIASSSVVRAFGAAALGPGRSALAGSRCHVRRLGPPLALVFGRRRLYFFGGVIGSIWPFLAVFSPFGGLLGFGLLGSAFWGSAFWGSAFFGFGGPPIIEKPPAAEGQQPMDPK